MEDPAADPAAAPEAAEDGSLPWSDETPADPEAPTSPSIAPSNPSRRASLTRAGKGQAVVALHIYDVGTSTVVSTMNHLTRLFGTGAFHAAVEVYGREYSFGYFDDPPGCTGIFACEPMMSQHHTYRDNISLGNTTVTEEQLAVIISEMENEWIGSEYDLLRKNCCHFSDEFVKRLGFPGIPRWVQNLAGAGATVMEGFNMGADLVGMNKIVEMAKAAALSNPSSDEAITVPSQFLRSGTKAIDLVKDDHPSNWAGWISGALVQAAWMPDLGSISSPLKSMRNRVTSPGWQPKSPISPTARPSVTSVAEDTEDKAAPSGDTAGGANDEEDKPAKCACFCFSLRSKPPARPPNSA